MAAIAEFKQQDWVKQLAQDRIAQQATKKHMDPNVAFPFQDDFLVGTIHSANNKAVTPNTNKVLEIQDNKDKVSILTTKTAGNTQLEDVVGSRVSLGSNPVRSPTTNSNPPGAASGESEDPTSAGPASRADGGLTGK